MSIKHYIIIDNICGWPNLTKMPDGSLISVVFNQPTHGLAEGEEECYASRDGGETWRYLSTPVMHKEQENHMHVACGLAINKDFIVISGGWDRRPKPGEPSPLYKDCSLTAAVICRSPDGGKTFFVSDFGYSVPDGQSVPVPYGDIVQTGDRLACACYTVSRDLRHTYSYIIFSEDDGRTWTSHSLIANNHHETALLFFDDKNGIAISRENSEDRLDQYNTDDGGRTWRFAANVTGHGIHPGHLVKLSDGSLILTTGIRFRNNYGVGAMISKNQAKSWSRIVEIAGFGNATDGGYPSTVELDDGRLLTHYYSNKALLHDRYFVGQAIWDLSEFGL